MDTLVEDDICILNHEKAQRRETVAPLSAYPGDESVASHFALVTAYEDIKKRLKDSEKENSFLKKRIRALEEKLVGARVDEETSSVGREQVNKAYHAYREVCIDRDNLKNKLEKISKDNSESLKVLNEQLQSKEVELLQLRTEVETQQVMRNLNPPSSNWEVEKLSCDLKIHGLEQELELLRKECSDLRTELQKARQTDKAERKLPGNVMALLNFKAHSTDTPPPTRPIIPNSLPTADQAFKYMSLWGPFLFKPPQGPSQEDILQDRDVIRPSLSREERVPHQGLHHSDSVQHAYWDLRREMSNLHLVTQVQAELLRKLKASAAATKACTPVGCVEDPGRDSAKLHLTNFTATYKKHPPLSPNGKAACYALSPPLLGDRKVFSDKAALQSWTDNERLVPNDGADFQEHNSYGRNSLEDNSWVFPSPPKSSETTFGENRSKILPLPNLPPLHYLDQHNQNCLYKS